MATLFSPRGERMAAGPVITASSVSDPCLFIRHNSVVSDAIPARKPAQRRASSWILLEVLGSMNLAITLLVVVAIASIIGTVLQQNQPYADYVLKFGPFWFAAFSWLGLYDVYGSAWFIAILAFLILSTSVCLYRQFPGVARDLFQFRTRVQVDSLRGFHQCAEWALSEPSRAGALREATRLLQAEGYRWRVREQDDQWVAAAMKGRYHRLGYLFTHAAVVTIGIGGLLDGDLWLKWKEWRGAMVVETRDLAARDVPAASRLAPGATPSFRGHIMLPEGSAANFVFLRLRDGFVVQDLPFAIELKDFQVDYHATGQPKSFASQVLIHDEEHLGAQPLAATVRVNHPLRYRGYAIYQSDFGDGGSKLELRAWPLNASRLEPLDARGEVGGVLSVKGGPESLRLELSEFRLFNLLPEPDAKPGDRKFRNFGPSIGFKLRDAAGEAREYLNYMAPARLEDRWFFISGARSRPGEPFAFLHVPADANDSPERFLRFNARVRDREKVRALLARAVATPAENADFRRDLNLVRFNLVDLFIRGGFAAVIQRAQAVVPAERLQEATKLYLDLLRDALAEIFIEVLREEGVNVEQGVGEREDRFFNDALSALAALPGYGSPFYLQLTRFQQVEASGLQVTHGSATPVVYAGFAFLIIGVFVMFYTCQKRLWVWIGPQADGWRLVLAGASHRRPAEFAREFARLKAALGSALGASEPRAQERS